MAANTAPIFTATPKTPIIGGGSVGAQKMTAANAATDGSGTQGLLYLAGANGGRVDKVRLTTLGTNVASVARIYLNNGGANATPTNNALIKEFPLPITTLSQTTGQTEIDLVLDMPIQAGYQIMGSLGTAVAAGWMFTAFAGDY